MNTTNIRNLWRAATLKKRSKVIDPLSGGIGHLWKLSKNCKTNHVKLETKKCSTCEKTCPICYEPMSYASETSINGCGHTFCAPCIIQWSEKFNLTVAPGTCPCCRELYTDMAPKNKPCGTCHNSDHSTKMCPHKKKLKDAGFRERAKMAAVDLKTRDLHVVGMELSKTYRGLVQTIINKAVNHVLHHSRVDPNSPEFDEKLNRRLLKTTGIELNIYERLLNSTCKHLQTVRGNFKSTAKRIESYRNSL